MRNLIATLKQGIIASKYSETYIGNITKKKLRRTDNMSLLKMGEKKNENHIRILGGNINTFPVAYTIASKMKREKLKNLVCATDVDILTITEHNLNLNKLAMDQKPSEILEGWRSKTITKVGYMENDDSIYSQGGNGVITFDNMAKKVIDIGNDSKNLGRWTWCTYRGKHDNNITIISCYRPDESQVTYKSQLAAMAERKMDQEPGYNHGDAWFNDLSSLIKQKFDRKEEVLVIGDFNDNLENKNSRINKTMEKLQMSNILSQRYGRQKATHVRGSECIDGIYASQGIKLIQGGYIPFEWVPGDHRWPWADIIMRGSGEDQRNTIIKPLARKATSKIPSIRKEFNDKLNQHLEEKGIEDKIILLEKLAKDENVQHKDIEELYESIDERFRRAIAYADKRCKKGRRGPIPFSDEAKRILGTYTLLKLILIRFRLKRKTGRPRMKRIQRLAKKVKSTIPLAYSTEKEILEQVKINAKEYRSLQENADEYRSTYLGNLASELSETDGKEKEWHLKQLKFREKNKRHWKNIKKYEYRGRGGGVSKVDIDTDEGLVTVHDKERIVDAIIQANRAKRLQASNTPFRTEPLRTNIGEKGNFKLWEDILNEKYEVEGLSNAEEGTKLFIKYLQSMKQQETKITWSQQDYIESWKHMSEEKSSYPGIATAHMKCIHPDSLAARVASALALIPFITGYCPKYWKVGIDSMIPKKDMTEFRPEKLRLILLMDVRFNHANKLVGKKIMEFGEHHGLLSNEQFGSRKAKSALEHATNKRIILDIARQNKCKAVYLTNDAKSCYDRILLMVAYMTMRRFGIPINVAKSVITGLMDMVCRIRTAHGDSKKSYCAKDVNEFLHGIGQGNGYGPAIWAAISSILFKILQDLGYGTNVIAPITRELLNLVAISFVDDTDSITLGKPGESWQELIQRAQKGLDMWECLIRTTGGAIEPGKSFWVGISPSINDRGDTELTAAPNYELWITGLTGEKEKLTKKAETEANLGLGVWQAPDGQENTQEKMTIKKIRQWNSNVRSFKVDKFEGRSMINMTIGKKVRYPLAATALDADQCDRISKTLTWSALGKAGVVRTASQLIVNAPTKYGGMGIRTNVREMQLIDHVKMILRHGHRQTVTGKLIRATAETLCIESGVIEDPFQLNEYELMLCTRNTWITSTVKMLTDSDIKLTSNVTQLCTWANEDETLIDNIQEYKGICGKTFNKVRIFLRVVTLSDICSADFRFIDKNCYNANRNYSTVTPSLYSYNWPQVNRITESDKKEWQKGLKLIFQTDDTRRLNQTCMRDWDAKYIDRFIWTINGENTVYQKISGDKWQQWTKVFTPSRYRIRSKKRYVRSSITVVGIPRRCKPISVTVLDNNMIQIDTIGNVREEYDCQEQDHWTVPIFNTDNANKDRIIDEVKNGETKIIIGEYHNNRSYAKFGIEGTELVGVATVPDTPSKYRQVLGGILIAVKYIQQLATQYELNHGICTIISTCRGALLASLGAKEPNLAWKQIDLLDMVRTQTTKSNIKWKMRYLEVESIPDSRWAQYFDRMNNDITNPQESVKYKCTTIIEGERWKIDVPVKAPDRIEEGIRDYMYEDKVKRKWMKYLKITEVQMKEISWDLFQAINVHNTSWKQIFMAKYNSRILPVMKNMKRRKHSDNDLCPNCGAIETTEHIMQCKADVQEEEMKVQIHELETFLATTTSVHIKAVLLKLVRYFRYNEALTFDENIPQEIKDLALQQASMGQAALYGGFWLQQWQVKQKEYYKRFKLRYSAKTWLVKVISKLQDILFSTWLTRNRNLHHNEESNFSAEQHRQLDQKINDIFTKIPHPRLLSLDGRRFFNVKKEFLLKRKRRAKGKWVREATSILDRYSREQTNQSSRFISYFAPD